MPYTFVQKVFAEKLGRVPEIGEIVEIAPDFVMSHDNAGLVIRQFGEMGAKSVFDPDKIAIILDHRIPAESVKTAEGHKKIRQFVKEQGITRFHDIGRGICHQVMVEEGYAKPGEIILGTDSHTTTYGALSAFSTGIGATEMASVWALGKLWLRVPETIKIDLTCGFQKGVYAKDLIIYIIGKMTVEGANYLSVEYHGSAVKNLTISERLTIANMSMEMGAKNAIFPPDSVLSDFTGRKIEKPLWADDDAHYKSVLDIDLSSIEPMASCPHSVDNVRPIAEIAGKKVNQVLIGTCTNGRIDDLKVALDVMGDEGVHKDVRLIVCPASSVVLEEALKLGYIERFVRAGAVIIPPGCGPCLGAHQGLLAEGEVCASTSNRNFVGRMGASISEVYLMSPASAAVCAVMGEIGDVREYLK
ncbi:MAG: 3-isopropylmalate dehydratase large subunit [bacterium]